MRRLLLLAAFGVAVAAPVHAGGPVHTEQTIGPLDYYIPAGEFCDFNYHQRSTIHQDIKQFFNADGTLVRVIISEAGFELYENLGTGITATGSWHDVIITDPVEGTVTQNGQYLKVFDWEGRLAFISAGRLVTDLETGDILSVTPGFSFPSLSDLCALLGGALAQ